MKHIILFLLTATTAGAAYVNLNTQSETTDLPTGAIFVNGQVYPSPPPFSALKVLGWRTQNAISNAPAGTIAYGRTWVDAGGTFATAILSTRTTNEQAQIDASNAVAQAALSAALPPPEFPRGIVIPAATNGTPSFGIGTTPDGDLFTYIDHASPRDPVAAASNKLAAILARAQIRIDLKTVRTNIATSIDNCTTNIADMGLLSNLTNGFTAAENRSLVNALRRELEDADREMKAVAQELRDVRKALSQSLKDSTP